MFTIKTFIGRKLNYVNGILRRQVELDRYLKIQKDIKLEYIYYEAPKNPIDFFSKRYLFFPYYSRKESFKTNIVNHITFQYLGDLGHFLDESRTMITCHDIFTFLVRNDFKNPYFIQKYSLSGIKRCRYVISISEFTKSELIHKFNIPKDKIIVIRNGMNQNMFYKMTENELNKIPTLLPEFKKILHVGTEEYRKNFITLLKALYLLKKRIKNIMLIRIGVPSHQAAIKALGLEKNVVYFKDISNQRLREIYNLSDIYVYPSLYEGWGAPGLEAASCGTPVIASDIPVFKEIYRDFPIYFPPKNYKDLAKKIQTALDDENLKKDMSKRGQEIVKLYSWKKSSEKYFKLAKFIINN